MMKLNKVLILTTVLIVFSFIAVPLSGVFSVRAEQLGPYITGTEKMGKLIKVIDKNNVDEIKDALPVCYYVRVAEWGLKIRITEPKPNNYKPSAAYTAATEQNKKVKVIIDPKKGLLNYNDHGGSPFPGPKTLGTAEENLITGMKIHWNCEKSYKGDDFVYPYFGHFMGPRGDERAIGGAWDVIKWVGRTDLDPIGSFEPNPKGVEHKELIYQTYPFELKGTSICTVRYLDAEKTDDMWIYIASLRRIRRMSTAQRCDTYIGSDFIFDDFRGCSWKVETAYHKFLGEKNMWLVMNQVEDLKYSKGAPYPQRTNPIMEKRPCYINEVKHHDPNYIYGKRIVYYDKQTYFPVTTDVYDVKGQLWKSINYTQNILDKCLDTLSYDVYDMQARCSTLMSFKDPKGGSGQIVNYNPDPNNYSTAYLKKLGR